MSFTELTLLAIGVSMDAFAVSLSKGLAMKKRGMKSALVIALFFGGFQALMPLLGWVLGNRFSLYITGVGHWVAFTLLTIIGGKMVYEALKGGECPPKDGGDLCLKGLLLLAIATSIDALAVGVSFAFLQVEIISAIMLIGSVTFIISFAGVYIGNSFGKKSEKKAEIAGGIVLILIGIKILLENLGVF